MKGSIKLYFIHFITIQLEYTYSDFIILRYLKFIWIILVTWSYYFFVLKEGAKFQSASLRLFDGWTSTYEFLFTLK